jgi:hypothetical protein
MLAATAQAQNARVSVLKENGAAVGFLVQASRAEGKGEIEVARVILGPAARAYSAEVASATKAGWVAREVREVGDGGRRGVELRNIATAATRRTSLLTLRSSTRRTSLSPFTPWAASASS